MKEMTAKELEEKLVRKEAVNIVDVREVEEVAEGKIPEACNIPLGLLEFRMHELTILSIITSFSLLIAYMFPLYLHIVFEVRSS